MTNTIKDQFVSDMQVAGLAAGSKKQYLNCVNAFLKETWLAPDTVTEHDVQQFLISLRDKDVAGETFRGYRFALAFFFGNYREEIGDSHLLSRCYSHFGGSGTTRQQAFACGVAKSGTGTAPASRCQSPFSLGQYCFFRGFMVR